MGGAGDDAMAYRVWNRKLVYEAGSYTNLKAKGPDAFKNKYAGKYLPADVKNWSDQQVVSDGFAKIYAGSYINLNSMDSKKSGGEAYRREYAGKYLPADVKNWSDQQGVSDALTKKYAGSYINLNAMDSKKDGGEAFRREYASKYLPVDVKNWSDQQAVRDAFRKRYDGSSVNLNAMESDKSFNVGSSQLSDSRSKASPPSGSVPSVLSRAAANRPVQTHAATAKASQKDVDTNAVIELASIPEQGQQTASHASLITAAIAATFIVAGIFIVPSVGTSRNNRVLEPLLD